MSKHTPGPWEVVGNPREGYRPRHKHSGAFGRAPSTNLAMVSRLTEKLNVANLNAAAPTMYEAIRDALIGIGMARNAAMDGRTDEVLLHLGHHEARLQKSIAKVEG